MSKKFEWLDPEVAWPDTLSPDFPLFLLESQEGEEYRGQSNGMLCDHPTARGYVFTLPHKKRLQKFLDDRHYRDEGNWHGRLSRDAIGALNDFMEENNIPLLAHYGDEA